MNVTTLNDDVFVELACASVCLCVPFVAPMSRR